MTTTGPDSLFWAAAEALSPPSFRPLLRAIIAGENAKFKAYVRAMRSGLFGRDWSEL